MPDNLNISTPISGNTSINRMNQPPKEPPQINAIDPAKVTQPNTNKQTEQNTNFDLMLSRNSVFSTFMEQLRQTPALNQTLQKIMYDLFSRKENIKDTKAITILAKQLTSAAEMDKTDILKNLLFQNNNQTKFSGPFFDVLRGLSVQHANSDLNIHLANFLKSFDSVFSAPDSMKAIVKQLDTLVQQMPKYYSRKLQPLLEELLQGESANSTDLNLQILKEKIIPVLSEYASATNDSGRTRDTITLLVHNLARLNTSSREDLVSKFSTLLDYCRYGLNLPDEKINTIQELFVQCIKESANTPKNEFYDSLITVLSEGSKQNTSNLSQMLYKDVCSSLLMDKSVYMPFTHIFLPINYQGQFMFSEIWIEKEDAENHFSKQNNEERRAKTTRLFLTFDIKNLGYFEASIELCQLKAAVKMSYPATLGKSSREIRDKIAEIFSQNGFTAENVVLSTDNTPKISNQVMKKIYERRNIIDVSI